MHVYVTDQKTERAILTWAAVSQVVVEITGAGTHGFGDVVSVCDVSTRGHADTLTV